MTTDTVETQADLVALVGSRLCHDLISPLGAIGNGVELLAMSGAGMSPELQLIADSVAAANARVKFFRVAFGQATRDQRIGRPEVVAMMAEVSQSGRLKITWAVEGDQSRQMVKMCFLALLCLEAALPWGGDVAISETAGSWQIVAAARRTKPDPELWARLDGEGARVSPAQVQFALLPRAALDAGRQVQWQITDAGAAITF